MGCFSGNGAEFELTHHLHYLKKTTKGKKKKKKEGSFLVQVSPHLPSVHGANRRCFAVPSLEARSAAGWGSASQFAFPIAMCLGELQPAWRGLMGLVLLQVLLVLLGDFN